MTDEKNPDAKVEDVIEDEAAVRHLPDNEVLSELIGGFEDVVWLESKGQDVVQVPHDRWLEFARAARDAGFEVCADVTVVDWMRKRPERFEVVANLLSMSKKLRLRMTTTTGREDPRVESLVPVWPGVNFAEREAFDMFGVGFDGHPDLTRILMPDEWEGHPLRKDFGVGGVPVQFKESHTVS
ncbi:MAG: NADH-quinone oxidoreductase subunit C [Acidimicrobiia bacterium]